MCGTKSNSLIEAVFLGRDRYEEEVVKGKVGKVRLVGKRNEVY